MDDKQVFTQLCCCCCSAMHKMKYNRKQLPAMELLHLTQLCTFSSDQYHPHITNLIAVTIIN